VANLVDNSGDATSNLVAGNGTASAVFTMPGTVALQVESVVATVDNSAGGDTTAQLTVRDQSGVVIATKRQDDVIPAGGTGHATFALRLDNAGGGIRFNKHNQGTWLYILATGNDPATGLGSIYLQGDNEIQIRTPFMYLKGDDSAPMRLYNFTLLDIQCDAVNVLGTPGGVFIQGDQGGVYVQSSHAGVGGFTVADQSGQALFQVDPDGSLHGRTGKTLVFDL